MNDYEKSLDDYRAEIVALETRARTLRNGFSSADHEADRCEADRLEEEARSLRVLLPMLMRLEANADNDDAEEQERDDEESDNDRDR